MEDILNYLYAALLLAYTLGAMIGIVYLSLREHPGEMFEKSRFFRLMSSVFLWISWLLIAILLMAIDHPHWSLLICAPPLLLLSGISLWEFSREIFKSSKNKHSRKISTNSFIILNICFAVLLTFICFFKYCQCQ